MMKEGCALLRWMPALVVAAATVCGSLAAERPNVLWITCEDTGPHLGCYGDALARTTRLDRLAEEGVLYENAFAYCGVCAPSRSCLITGIYPLRLGSGPMRSATRLPESVRILPALLRRAGYWTSNNSKTDYNFPVPAGAWDQNGRKAHWRGRRGGTPFFSVFNLTVCHQSQIFCSEERWKRNIRRLTPAEVHDPATMVVPPYHPDTPEFRKEWARHYDNVTAMDYQVGDILDQLEEDGLADDTIVFFFSDHGTGMPGVKKFVWYDSLRVPLLIRFPEKWRHLAPSAPGTRSERLVSFVDFAPSVLSLVEVPVPAEMQGTAFLGAAAGSPREVVFGGNERDAEVSDGRRYVFDGRWHYVRNFRPWLADGEINSYVEQHAGMKAWREGVAAGSITGPAARFFAKPRPFEELYDISADPRCLRNLAGDPAQARTLERLRNRCRAEMKAHRDLGLLPERQILARSRQDSPYAMAADPQRNPLERLLEVQALASRGSSDSLPDLMRGLADGEDSIRWWSAMGLAALGKESAPAREGLLRAAQDRSPEVRVAAAEALAHVGERGRAHEVLRAVLRSEHALVRLEAGQVIGRLGAVELAQDLRRANIKGGGHPGEYFNRMTGYLPDLLEKNHAP